MNLKEIEQQIQDCFKQIELTKSNKRKNDLFKRINRLKKLKQKGV